MKFLAFVALITAALAKIENENYNETAIEDLECTPPAYACKSDFSGWLVCNVDGWYIDGGDCGPDAWCEYINDLPYCIS
ncbi:hypothetical protein F4781DRAFT_433648 [Annulohypoxylon bovei var. microspora]|nr:hypothetical protein F4781DRAFT_433648 [Annulohypoxylon bovei var. microspora]